MVNRGKIIKLWLAGLAILLLVSVVIGPGCLPFLEPLKGAVSPRSQQAPPEMEQVSEVWNILSREYVDKQALDTQKLSQGAIRGMLEALNDPYTSYLDAEAFKLELSGLRGEFEGIGAYLAMRESKIMVIAPMPDSPAERAGIRAGDVILEIDGESTAKMSLQDAVTRIRGPRGTSVALLIRHDAEEKPALLTIVRAEIRVSSVHSQVQGGLAHISIAHFVETTAEELQPILADITRQQVKGIILDLRDNPGGLLMEVIDVASQFLPEGETVTIVVDNKGQRTELKAKPGGVATRLPLVVLVNGHSASGSEVLAGALQDHGRAIIMGSRTFGKGSVNTLYPLKGGSGLFLTISRWLTPKGNPIEGKGLSPDTEVVATPEDLAQGRDVQMERARDYLGGQDKARAGWQPVLTGAG